MSGRTITDDGNSEPLAIPEELRSRHCYLIGKSGTGKTTLVSNMIVHDMERGHGLAFLDSHGDAAKNLLGCVPRERLDDVIYYNPMARMSPAFNPLRLPYDPAKLAADMLSVFQTFSGDSWESAPRMQHVLRNAFTLLITDSQPHTLRDLRTLSLDPHMRQDVISRAKDPDLIDFWTNEFPTIPQSSVQPILTRLSALLAPLSPLARIFSNPENELDFSAMLQQGKIFIVNLAKGEMGDEPSKLLGGLFTAAFQQAALARARIPEAQRRPFFLYVDEFQNFTIKSTFDSILSESRKYRLYLTLAHQDISQIPQNIRSAIFGNVATLISFGISANDAPVLRKEMHRTRLSVRIPETPDYTCAARFSALWARSYRFNLAAKGGVLDIMYPHMM